LEAVQINGRLVSSPHVRVLPHSHLYIKPTILQNLQAAFAGLRNHRQHLLQPVSSKRTPFGRRLNGNLDPQPKISRFFYRDVPKSLDIMKGDRLSNVWSQFVRDQVMH
jgi:hypothetical protein